MWDFYNIRFDIGCTIHSHGTVKKTNGIDRKRITYERLIEED